MKTMFNPNTGKRIHLTHGAGDGVDKACLMTASNMLIGKGCDGDKNSCVCPVIRVFIIPTNDAIPEELLGDLYGPLAWEILGTATDDSAILQQRAYRLADWAVREIAPIALDAIGLQERANSLRSLPPIVDQQSARSASYATYATDSAYTADASDSAHAASSAHAARAARSAARAARAAAYDADTDTANQIWRMCPEIIREVAAIGDRRPVETVIDHCALADALAN